MLLCLSFAIPKEIFQPLFFWQKADTMETKTVSITRPGVELPGENVVTASSDVSTSDLAAAFLVEHPPLWLDVRQGQVMIFLKQLDIRQPEYEYDEEGQLKRLVLANKAIVHILYDDRNRVIKIIGPGIKKTVVSYPDKLTWIVTQGSKKEVYQYYPDDRRLTITDALGYCTTKEFDSHNRLVRIIDQLGNEKVYVYDDGGNLISFTNELGQKERYKYDVNGNLIKKIAPSGNAITCSYNESGQIASITNSSLITENYEYDKRGNIIKYTNPLGETYHMNYDELDRLLRTKTPGGLETKYRYDQYDNTIEIVDSTGEIITMEYDEMDNLVSKKINDVILYKNNYDIYGRIISEENALGYITRYSYDEDNNLNSIIYPNGAVYKYDYDINGNIISMTSAVGEVTKYEYLPTGLLTKIYYSNGTSEEFSYDKQGQLISKKDIRGNLVSFAYDKSGNLKTKTDSIGNVTTYRYDELSRLIKIVHPSGEKMTYKYIDKARSVIGKNQDGLKTTYFYDALGKVTKIMDSQGNTKLYYYDPDSNLTKMVASSGNTTIYRYKNSVVELEDFAKGKYQYNYDSLGRLVSIANKLGNIAAQEYDSAGRLIKTKNLLGYSERFQYDSMGDLKSVTDCNGNTKNYRYDNSGRLVKIIDPLGDVFKINYNSSENTKEIIGPKEDSLLKYRLNSYGDVIEMVDALGNSTSYQYDSHGDIVSIKKNDGNVIKYSYDKYQRVIQVVYPDGNIDKFSYDKYGNIATTENSDLKETYKYDKWQRLVEVARTHPDVSIRYQYDNLDRLTKLTYPSGNEFRYYYDNIGRLKEISDKANSSFLFSYDQVGRLELIQYPSGIRALYEYGPLGRLISLKHLTVKGEVIVAFLYNYDADGNIVSIKKQDSPEVKYSYDRNNQLVSHQPAKSECKYDSNGNISSIDGVEFIYDSQDRLKTTKLADNRNISYGYSPQHKRIWKDTGSGKVYYIYSGDYVIAEIKDGVIMAEYLYGPLIDQPLQMVAGENTYYYHADRIGSIAALTNNSQDIVAEYEYDSWGNVTKSTNSIPNSYLYTGREYESESRIYYYRNRYYSPSLGQFLTKDLIPEDLQNPLTFNPYIYADNNPLRYKDPLGLSGGGARFMDLAEGIERPLNLSSVAGGRPVDYNIGKDVSGNRWYYSHGSLLPNSNMVIHPTKGYLPNTPQNVQSAMNAMDRGIPQMSDQQASRIWSAQNPRLVDRTRTAARLDASMRPPPTPPTPTPPAAGGGMGRRFMQGASRLGGRISNYAGRIPGRIFAAANPLLVPFYGTSVGVLTGAGSAGAAILSAGVLTAGAVGVTGGTLLNQIGVVQRGATAAMTPVAGLFVPAHQTARAGPSGQRPNRGDVTARMTEMINNYGQVQTVLNNSDLWDRALGGTVTGPRGISLSSQAASATTASSDLGISHQQEISRIREMRSDLENYQNRIRNLMDQYQQNGGRVGNNWTRDWNSVHQDWNRVRTNLGNLTRTSGGGGGGHRTSSSGSSSSSSSSSSGGGGCGS